MATFYYRAIDRSGKLLEGTQTAESVEELRERLAGRHQFLVEISEQRRHVEMAPVVPFQIPFISLSVSDRELAVLAWQLHMMLGAGLPIVKSLELLSRQTQNTKLKEALEGICRDLSRGDDFSVALSRRRDIFPALFSSMVETGELAGNLDVTMKRLAEYLDRACDMRDKLMGALAYPVMLMGLSGLVSVFLLVFVLPRLSTVFEGAGVPMPALTRYLVGFGSIFYQHWALAILGLVTLTASYVVFSRTERGRQVIDRLWLELPGIGPIVMKSIMMRLTQTLSTLQASGISITASLSVVEKSIGNVVIAALIRKIQQGVMSGEPLSAELIKTETVPELVTTMVAVGEETGTLSEMLERVALVYVKEVEVAVSTFTRVIEPIMLVVMTLVVGSIAAAIYLPIADLSTTIGK